jgi:hypothetical protein
MLRKLLIIICLGTTLTAYAQETNFWHVLAEVGFASNSLKDALQVDKPVFGKHLLTWNQKKITLKGYLIPLSEVNGKPDYMLSSLPFSMCYFCGGAGPETVVELQTKEKIKFVTKAIRVEGVLYLNDKDPDHHMYILRDVKILD